MRAPPNVAALAFDMWRAARAGEAGLALRRERRLVSLIQYARTRSAFYRRLYDGLPPENVALGALPPVTKQELMGAFDDWVADVRVTRADVETFATNPSLIGTRYRDDLFVCTSSGTTGHPGLFLHDPYAVSVYRGLVLARIDLAWLGPMQWLRLAARGLRWASVMGTGGHFVGSGWMELDRQRSAWRQHAYRVLSVQRPLHELVSELNAFDPTVLSAYPSALEQLAQEQRAGRLHLRPILAEIAGESWAPDAVARMADAFGCEIHNVYGASEFPFFAASCAHGWLHVSSDWAILEPVDAHFGPTPPGEPSHTVLLTNLANRIQPIIRYDLGDSVLVKPDACPCGRHLPAIRVAGRRDDVLRLRAASGQTVAVLPLAIGAVVEETHGVHRSQLIQAGPSTLHIRLDPEPGVDVEHLWRKVLDDVQHYLGAQGLSNVDLVRKNESPESNAASGKFRQVIGAPIVC